jgi:hypothetical protein
MPSEGASKRRTSLCHSGYKKPMKNTKRACTKGGGDKVSATRTKKVCTRGGNGGKSNSPTRPKSPTFMGNRDDNTLDEFHPDDDKDSDDSKVGEAAGGAGEKKKKKAVVHAGKKTAPDKKMPEEDEEVGLYDAEAEVDDDVRLVVAGKKMKKKVGRKVAPKKDLSAR